MAVIRLTDRCLQGLKTTKKQADHWDDSLPGFGVRLSPAGRKSFVVMYYSPAGKRRMTLGTYPALSLAEARQKAKEVLFSAALGGDPQAEKIAHRKSETFAALANEYLERHAKVKKRSWREDERMIDRDLLPTWKGRKARDIQRRDVILLLDEIIDRGAPVMANRVRALVSKIYNFGLGRDIVQHNPTLGVPRPSRERQRDRVLSEDEIRALWAALDAEEPVIATSFKLRLLTAQRGIEVLAMRWEHIHDDWWTIPAEASKNGLAHRVPLAPQCLALIDNLRPLTGHSPWVFPSPTRPGAHIRAVTKAAHRIKKAASIDFVPHDLRRTAASYMTAMGTSRLVVSKILNHVERGITAVYDRYSYDAEKRVALEGWAERAGEITTGSPQYTA